jgi:hypothetical protein
MSNFHFLKKDLEWKIVNLQCRVGTFSPHTHNPQMTPYHLLSLVTCSRKKLYTLEPWHRARSALIPLGLFVPPSLSLFYTRSREKIPLLGTSEMSDKSRYEWWLYLHPFIAPIAFFTPYILSLELSFKRENYTPTIIPPSWELQKWVTNWDMSGKSF